MRRLTAEESRLVEKCGGFVHRLAAALSRQLGLPAEDLAAAGIDAFLRIAMRFDSSRNANLEAYAYFRVRGAMLDEAARVRVRYSPLQRLNAAAAREDAHEVQEPASVEELMSAPSRPPREEARMTLRDQIASYVAHAAASHDSGAEDRLIQVTEYRHAIAALHRVLDGLGEPDQSVVRGLYWGQKTLDEIANDLGISKKTAWRAHTRSKPKLREALAAQGITAAPSPEP